MDTNVPLSVRDFFCDYQQAFDPLKQHPGTYGASRVDSDIMLTYDAIYTLVKSYQATGKVQPAAQDIQHALQSFNICNPLQGVSGEIAFGPDGNPINKAIVLLTVNSKGLTGFEDIVRGNLQAPTSTGC